MAIKVELDVEYEGETTSVVVRPKSFKEFETTQKKSFIDYIENPDLTGTYWLAWHSFKLKGLTTKSFDDWLDGLDDVQVKVIGEEHPKDQPDQSSDTTSDSPSH